MPLHGGIQPFRLELALLTSMASVTPSVNARMLSPGPNPTWHEATGWLPVATMPSLPRWLGAG